MVLKSHLMSIMAARAASPSSHDSISSVLGSISPRALRMALAPSDDDEARWARQPAALREKRWCGGIV